MGSESTEVADQPPKEHGSPSRDDDPEPEEEEGGEGQVTPPVKAKRGTKRGSRAKKEEGAREEEEEEEGTKSKRPSRERKTVERYSAVSPKRSSVTKALTIEQGSGTKLKDIPNVAFKLSKRKADENLQALHVVLFGRKANAHFLKRNISQFSGFVWTVNEEKQKAKVKEKLDKYTKDKLIDFCEILDIHFPRASTKKEEVSAKLLEFLESPHVTTEVLLAEKDKRNKKRRSRTPISRAASGDTSSDKETKKQKKRLNTEDKKEQAESSKAEDENEDAVGSDGSKEASSGEEDNNDLQDGDHVKHEEEENEENESDSEDPTTTKKNSDDVPIENPSDEPEVEEKISPIKETPTKTGKSISKRVSKKAALPVEEESEPATASKTEESTKNSSKAIKEKATPAKKEETKKSSRKASLGASVSGPSKCSKPKRVEMKGQAKEKENTGGKKRTKKKEDKSAQKVSTKGQGKGKKNAGPSTEELHSVVSGILKEVDFNTATLADILKQLGAHFNMNLMDRKAEVKSIIEDVINNMTDDEEEDEESSGDDKEEDAKEGESDGGEE